MFDFLVSCTYRELYLPPLGASFLCLLYLFPPKHPPQHPGSFFYTCELFDLFQTPDGIPDQFLLASYYCKCGCADLFPINLLIIYEILTFEILQYILFLKQIIYYILNDSFYLFFDDLFYLLNNIQQQKIPFRQGDYDLENKLLQQIAELQEKNKLTMSNPLQLKLENEIKKRINENQLSRNDLEFYQRKIRRLENEHAIAQDEVSKLRVKLKRAEDFEFKYQLLFKQMTDLKSLNEANTNELILVQTLNQQLKTSLQQKSANVQDFTLQRANLLQQISKWKSKFQQLLNKSKLQLQDQRIRSQQSIKRQTQKVRSQYKQKQQDYEYQIRQLKKVIQQKQTYESIINQRVDKIRGQKDDQISRLKGILKERKQTYDNYIKEKNEEMEKMKDKFQKMINFDIQNLKHNQEDQQEIFSIQLNGLRQMIGLKNDQIQKLLLQIKRQSSEHESNRKQLLQQITILKQKIYTVQKQSEIQLQNLKNRLILIHSQDIKTVQDRHEKIVDSLKVQISDTKRFIKQLQRMRENQKMQFERMKHQFHDRMKQKDKRISDLGENLSSRGQLNAAQLKALHQSFHQITSQKQDLASQYQANIVFLNQQISKLNSINEIKTQQITKLHQQLHNLKISYEQRLIEGQSKYRRQRKQRQQQRQQQRLQRQKTNERIQDMERQFKNKQRRFQRQREKIQRQRNKAQYMLEEAERDIERLNKYIKQLDENLKNQFKKNQLSLLDKDSLRREILSELEKQKVELEAMKLMEMDQIKKKYEIQNARLTTSNQQLKTDLLNKSIAFQTLQSQFKKLDHKNRNMDKLQKDKIKQYQQKMMTLNHEINITQNLYQTFLEAKARAQA